MSHISPLIPIIRHNKTDTARAMSVKFTLLTSFFAVQAEGATTVASLDELLDCKNLENFIFIPPKKYLQVIITLYVTFVNRFFSILLKKRQFKLLFDIFFHYMIKFALHFKKNII